MSDTFSALYRRVLWSLAGALAGSRGSHHGLVEIMGAILRILPGSWGEVLLKLNSVWLRGRTLGVLGLLQLQHEKLNYYQFLKGNQSPTNSAII